LSVDVVGVGGEVIGTSSIEVEVRNEVVSDGGGEEGGGGVGVDEISSGRDVVYINLSKEKQSGIVVVNKDEVEWVKVYDLKGRLISSTEGDSLDINNYKVGSYIFEMKLKNGKIKYGKMIVLR